MWRDRWFAVGIPVFIVLAVHRASRAWRKAS
jgi:hypothetical protein